MLSWLKNELKEKSRLTAEKLEKFETGFLSNREKKLMEDGEAKKLIKKTRFSKYFRLALHGWMEYHIAAMEISTNSFLSNPTGRGARKILEGNFAPKK